MNKNLTSIEHFQVDYDHNHILSKCEDVVLEARRVLLNEELDKIGNITLSKGNHTGRHSENCLRQCKDTLIRQNDFWKELPNAEKPKKVNCIVAEVNNEPAKNLDHIGLINNVCGNEGFIPKTFTNGLLKKYFNAWKQTVKNRNEKVLDDKLDKSMKLDKLIQKIKKCKKDEITNHSKDEHLKETSNVLKLSHNYKNRFVAQKSIIDMQKAKLEEQNKIIEELRLGIIREDLLKSLDNTKINIREIFNNCSERVKCKVPILLIEENKNFTITTQKAPKIVQQMERRALQRAQNRQIILERKRLIEEARQKLLEEAIEKKRIIEEEERKNNLEVMKERRRKELELEKVRQEQKQKYIKSLNRATDFYNRVLIKKCFNRLFDHVTECQRKDLMARNYYETNILQKSIYCMSALVEQKYKVKYGLADAHFAYKILKTTVRTWYNFYIESVRNMQVAEDIYDFHLTSHTFVHWHRYVCSQIVLRDKKIKIAENHYKRKILLQYYYQWRSLPAVIQLEKAKELKKQKWREKVWEVIPDYKPPEDI